MYHLHSNYNDNACICAGSFDLILRYMGSAKAFQTTPLNFTVNPAGTYVVDMYDQMWPNGQYQFDVVTPNPFPPWSQISLSKEFNNNKLFTQGSEVFFPSAELQYSIPNLTPLPGTPLNTAQTISMTFKPIPCPS